MGETTVSASGLTIRYLVIAQLAFGLLGLLLDLAFESTLPAAVREYSENELARPWGIVDYGLGLWAALSVVASLGLIALQQWARGLYVVTSIGSILLLPLSTASVAAVVAEPLYQASVLANGAVLGVLLMERRSAQR